MNKPHSEHSRRRFAKTTGLTITMPMISRPSVLCRKLFAIPEDQARMNHLLKSGCSDLPQ